MTIEPLAGKIEKGESRNATIACNDYLRMGPGRQLVRLIDDYQDKSNFVRQFKPPTLSIKTVETWSSRYNWANRASIYDAEWERRKNKERENEMIGLALDYERIKRLKRLVEFLEGQIYELSQPNKNGQSTFVNVWTPDVKQIGVGYEAEMVEVERFNSALIREYRAALDDLAKETGGRKTQVINEHSWRESVPDGINADAVFEQDVEQLLQLMTEGAIDG